MLSQRGIAAAAQDPRGIPLQTFQRIHARILERSGEYRQAHKWYLAALATARRWRLDLLPADAFRSAGESSLAPLYEEALSNAAHLYFDLGQKDVLIDAWLAAADWRASSLRRSLDERRELQARIGPEYWEVLAKYRRADAASLRVPSREGSQEMERLQVRLAELESYAGISSLIEPHTESFSSVKALIPYRLSLRGSQALISFQLGETLSHRWILGSSSLSWIRLPPRRNVARLSDDFGEAVRNGSSAAPRLGRELGSMLFGNLSGEAERARSWVLVPDDVLFRVPFPALLLTHNGEERYLIERCSLTALPGAWSLTGKPVRAWKGDFVGVADAVYNSADPRWARVANARSARPVMAVMFHPANRQGQSEAATLALQLPRLAASEEEVQAAANAWFDLPAGRNTRLLDLKEREGSQTTAQPRRLLLTGMNANVRELYAALAMHPSIVHFAAHVIPNPKAQDRAYIALSLDPDGAPELLSTSDVAHMKVDDALVVLSGCESARGAAVPGSGLIGLVRAWLMSGAAAVIASQWPVPDDRGVIFETFYRELRKETALPAQSPVQSAAEALRRAQLEMLRTNSWRAQPKYWATYLITGRTG
jgi:CHAT domain-containing protein